MKSTAIILVAMFLLPLSSYASSDSEEKIKAEIDSMGISVREVVLDERGAVISYAFPHGQNISDIFCDWVMIGTAVILSSEPKHQLIRIRPEIKGVPVYEAQIDSRYIALLLNGSISPDIFLLKVEYDYMPSVEPAPSATSNLTNPWEDTYIRSLIDEWLLQQDRCLKKLAPGGRIDEWGRAIGDLRPIGGIELTGGSISPDRPSGWDNYRYIWENNWQPGGYAYKVREYVELRKSGRSFESLAICTSTASTKETNATSPKDLRDGARASGESAGAEAVAVSPTDNNQLGDAAEIRHGQQVKQSINPAGAQNWYKFRVDTSGILFVNLEEVPQDMRAEIKLRDKNFKEIAYKYTANPGDKLILEKDIAPGWHYFRVMDFNNKAFSEPYSLETTFEPAPDLNEPNNVLGDAKDITSGETIEASMCPRADKDWYKFRVDTPGILSINLEKVPQDMRAEIKLLDKNFKEIAYKYTANPGDKLILEKDIAPGWHYLRVGDFNDKAFSEPYSLETTFEPAPDLNEPNNVLGDAKGITSGETIEASMCPSADKDWYKFRVDTPGILSINLEKVPQDMRAEIKLLDKNFKEIAYKYTANPGDKLILEKDIAPGWHYLRVGDFNDKAFSEPYSLVVAMK